MSVTITELTQIRGAPFPTYRVEFTSTLDPDAEKTIRVDGYEVGTTNLNEFTFSVESGDFPLVEVLDSEDTARRHVFSGHVTPGWQRGTDVDHYRVEELVDSTWTLRDKVTDAGEAFFTYRTRWLEDQSEHQYRIIPVGDNGEQGNPDVRTFAMVRPPDWAEWTASLSAGTVTIDEA